MPQPKASRGLLFTFLFVVIVLSQMSTFLLFVLPVLLITCFYVLIGLKLRRSRAASQSLGLATRYHSDNVRVTSSSNGRSAVSTNGKAAAAASCGSTRQTVTPTPRKSIVKMLGEFKSLFQTVTPFFMAGLDLHIHNY